MAMIKRSILFIAILSFIQTPTMAEDRYYPYIPNNSFVNVEYVQNDTDLINFDNLKKKDKVEKAANEVEQNSPERLKLDTKQVIHQKALDYITRPSSDNIPIL